MVEHLIFKPLPGLSSPHAQTILASFSRPGTTPPSSPLLIPLSDGDAMFCQVSLPKSWLETQKTVVMIHGLGGSCESNYMIRVARKLYESGYKVVRVNLRGCGPGKTLARLPYHGGSSGDVFSVIQNLKEQTPLSPLILLGFSLGGNIAMKLSGELGRDGLSWLQSTIAVCSPIDLKESIILLSHPTNRLYHRHYLKQLVTQAEPWTKGMRIGSLYEFDDLITAPTWGFATVDEYYTQSSCQHYIQNIKNPCNLLFTADDPFVNYQQILDLPLPPDMRVFLCQNGGHMGFLGWVGSEHRYFWMDQLLLKWVENSGSS